jgi:hypothetical protein
LHKIASASLWIAFSLASSLALCEEGSAPGAAKKIAITPVLAARPETAPIQATIQTPKTADSSSNWFLKPPGWLTWVSLAGGLGAFLWRLWEYFVSRGDRETDRQTNAEAFWYETVVVPRILEPLLDFVTRQSDRLAAIPAPNPIGGGPDLFQPYFQSYQTEYAQLGARLRLLRVISQDVYDRVMARLDDLEDLVSLHCYSASATLRGPGVTHGHRKYIVEDFSDAMNYCVRDFKNLHASLYLR